jgi:hypothetical protein
VRLAFLSMAEKMALEPDRREMVELLEESVRRFADLAYTPEEVTEWFEQENLRLLQEWHAIS